MILNYANILIENDFDIISDRLREELEGKSFVTNFFDDTHKLFNILKNNNIDLLIIHNIKLLREIRKIYSKNILPAIVVTYNVNEAFEDIFEYGNDFVNAQVIEDDLIPKISIVLNRCQKVKNLVELTNKDFLTGVYNKRYFYEKANKIYNNNNNLALCMIDLDNFKMINDTYGHLVGDYAIKELANILKKNTKGKDLVSRFGGDEFCILLQDIAEDDAYKLIKKIQTTVRDSIFKIVNTKLNLTISIGFTANKYDSLANMINKADLNLLNSKKSKPKVKICTNCNLCKAVS